MGSLSEMTVDTLIQVIVAIGIFVLGVIVATIQRPKKRLNYGIITSIPLINATSEIGNTVKVLYEDLVIEGQIYVGLIRIANAGNVAITTSDYEKPLTIDFGARSAILYVSVENVLPKNLVVDIVSESDQSVHIRPILLNKGDEFTLKFMVVNSRIPKISARIVGISQITRDSVTSKTGREMQWNTLLVFGWFVGLYLANRGSEVLISSLGMSLLIGLTLIFYFIKLIVPVAKGLRTIVKQRIRESQAD